MKDPLIIGGHEFNSRFILGSGKFSLEMTKAVIENGGVEMATLALRRANAGGRENILDYMPEGITLLPKPCVLPVSPENSAVVTLLKLKSFTNPNI